MKQILSLIRRHRWLTVGTAAGSAVILLAGIGVFGARSTKAGTGARHVNVWAAVSPSSKAPAHAHAVRATRPSRVILTAATVRATARRLSAGHGAASAGVGAPTPAPSSRAVSLALLRATGLSPSQVTERQLCGPAGADQARCAAEALVLRSTGALVHPRVTRASSSGPSSGNGPAALQQAYDLSYLSQSGGGSDTVGIVDAYNDPTAASDLNAYRSNYGLSACTTTNGCFRELNENGGTTLPTATSQGWTQEISLDLDTVSAICPNCHILLVEASSANSGDMDTAMEQAAAQGVNQISDSWTMTSSSPVPGTYTFPGIATVAATGDSGYVGPGEDNYPAALPGVTAAGGTTLAPADGSATARGFSEGAWSGGGSGCDVSEGSKPTWQSDTGCTGRSYADLSADANPDTGLAVYDNGQWSEIGGTSLATPIVAAYYAITGLDNTGPQWAYTDSGALNDIVTGSNGTCSASFSYICNAGVGYDGPTGMGSISGATFTGAPGIAGPTIPTGQSSPTYTQSVSSTAAMIAGGIYRNDLDTKWWIQYGTTTGYGSQTAPVDIGAGSAPVVVNAELAQLAPQTLYHYRLVAENSDGTTYGADYSFTTAPPSLAASYVLNPTAPTPGSSVSFDASGSTAGTGATITDYSWNFGDGTHASPDIVDAGSTPTTTHTFTQRGQYAVTLTVTNSAGKTATVTQTITVDTPPTPAFTPSAQIAAPTDVSFNGSASSASAGGTITDYNWNFGDGTPDQDTGTTSTAQHTYTNPGVYTVTLTTTDDLNVSSTVSETVIAGAINASPTVPAPGTAVNFTVPSLTGVSGTITDYSWNFGDGTTYDSGTTPSATHTYSTRQDETVTLTITTTSQTISGTETVAVDDAPNAEVDTSPRLIGEPGQAVSFDGSDSDAESPGSIKTYTWNFGDGSAPVTSTSPTASHAYARTGTYEATLTVTDDLGATDSTTQQVIVDQPAAAFTGPAVTAVSSNALATFNAGASSDALGTITDYSWNFGDGSSVEDTDATPSATHAYPNRGSYTVTLTVTNSYGQTATTTQTVVADNSPTASFTPSTTLATAGGAIGFNGGASTTMDGSPMADYDWSFGDGTGLDTGGAPTTTHTYGTPGTYTVTLITTDDLGLTASASEQVTIQAAPVAATPPATSTPAPSQTSAPVHAPVTPAPLSTSLGGATKLKLAPALAHGIHVSLAVSQGARVSFQITVPVSESRFAGHKSKTPWIVLLSSRVQSLGAGTRGFTFKLPVASARELAGSGPLVLTVKVTITSSSGKTVTRSLKISLSR